MAWNDYIFDYENGAKFDSSRYQVNFTIASKLIKWSEAQWKFDCDDYNIHSELTSISGENADSIYAISWIEISDYNIDATSREYNILDTFEEYLTAPIPTYSGYSAGYTNLPMGSNNVSGTYNSSPFIRPTEYISRMVETNIPIIALYSGYEMQDYSVVYGRDRILHYCLTGDWDSYIQPLIDKGVAVNVNFDSSQGKEKEGVEFKIYNTGQRGTWFPGDIVEDVSSPFYRWVKLKLAKTSSIDGRLAFYRQGLDNGVIKLIPKITASIVECSYSTDGGASWTESNAFPFEYIYGARIDELGEFIYATREGCSYDSGCPIFESEEEADDWINHDPDADLSKALNYEAIANRYKIDNKTGLNESSTDMGDAYYFKSHFSQQYILDSSEVAKIASALFDTSSGGIVGIWEDIKKGLDMFGGNPMDSVCGLMFFPIDLTTIFTHTQNQSYIYFGGYQFRPGDLSVEKLLGYDGYLDLGEFQMYRSFPESDYRNYEPYCNVSIFLPYIGIQKLSYNKYVGKTVSVRYYIDLKTGGCMACLFADGLLYDYFNGIMGVQVPITLTDYAGYAEAQIRNLSNLAGVGGNSASAIGAAASGNVAGAVTGTGAAIGNFESALYNNSKININNFNHTKGASGAIGNLYLPQYIYLIFEFIKTEETDNLISLRGRATNKSGTLGSFSGYLQIQDIELRSSKGMSENEKNEFISLLKSGIII